MATIPTSYMTTRQTITRSLLEQNPAVTAKLNPVGVNQQEIKQTRAGKCLRYKKIFKLKNTPFVKKRYKKNQTIPYCEYQLKSDVSWSKRVRLLASLDL